MPIIHDTISLNTAFTTIKSVQMIWHNRGVSYRDSPTSSSHNRYDFSHVLLIIVHRYCFTIMILIEYNSLGGFRGLFPYIAALTSHSCKPNCLSIVDSLPPFTNRLKSQNCSSNSTSSSLIGQENLRKLLYGKQFKQSLCRLVAGRRVEVAFFFFDETLICFLHGDYTLFN